MGFTVSACPQRGLGAEGCLLRPQIIMCAAPGTPSPSVTEACTQQAGDVWPLNFPGAGAGIESAQGKGSPRHVSPYPRDESRWE